MTRLLGIALILSACLTTAQASEVRSENRLDAYYPEGPLVAGQRVVFAEMHKDRIVSWENGAAETVYESSGCGPSSIAPYGERYVVLCHMTDELHVISKSGRLENILDADSQGESFKHPNDASADSHGGVYFSASGRFRRDEQPSGALFYLAADKTIRRLAGMLEYSNGVHFDARTRLLYVSEHLGPRILSYPELAPGRLGRPAVFKNFARDKITPIDGFRLTGPDGLETDAQGNLYVAYYGAGVLFILSPEGEILHRLAGQEPLLTNVALADGDRTLVLTGSAIGPSRPFPGSVRKMENPLH